MSSEISENAVLLEAGKSLASVEGRVYEAPNGVIYIFHPDGSKEVLKDVKSFIGEDQHCSIETNSVNSFCDALMTIGSDRTSIKACVDSLCFLAELNFLSAHSQKHLGLIGMGGHRVTLRYLKSQDFKDWDNISDKWISQDDLSDFLENQLENILEPNGSQILSIVDNLTVHRNVYFSRSKNRTDGSFNLQYAEEKGETGNEMQLPSVFQVVIPVFEEVMDEAEMVEVIQFSAKLQYKLHDGRVQFRIKVPELDKEVLNVMRRKYATIKAELAQRGSPISLFL